MCIYWNTSYRSRYCVFWSQKLKASKKIKNVNFRLRKPEVENANSFWSILLKLQQETTALRVKRNKTVEKSMVNISQRCNHSKHYTHILMISICSLGAFWIQHDIHFVNYTLVKSDWGWWSRVCFKDWGVATLAEWMVPWLLCRIKPSLVTSNLIVFTSTFLHTVYDPYMK